MRTTHLLLAVAAVTPAFAQVNVDFEELGPQPGLFVQTTALRSQLISEGVDFVTVAGPNDGPAILNQSGNFGFNALSGQHFLAYNSGTSYANGGIPIPGVRINFSQTWSQVSIWVASNQQGSVTTLAAFNAQNQQISTASVENSVNWQQLTVNAPNISYVVLQSTAVSGAFDDLAAVPEPATVVALGAGLAAIARRRKA